MLEEFIKEYCDENTLLAHKYFEHYTWIDTDKEDSIIGFISYFPMEGLDLEYDSIISHNKDNMYTLTHWRVLRNIIKNRTRTIAINSDKSNNALLKGVKKYGGYFEGDDIYFPLETKED